MESSSPTSGVVTGRRPQKVAREHTHTSTGQAENEHKMRRPLTAVPEKMRVEPRMKCRYGQLPMLPASVAQLSSVQSREEARHASPSFATTTNLLAVAMSGPRAQLTCSSCCSRHFTMMSWKGIKYPFFRYRCELRWLINISHAPSQPMPICRSRADLEC